ncbi:MAG: hypothetical protein ACR2N4_18050 [Jatrophihabitans sp.]
MNITETSELDAATLLAALRQTPLRGFGCARPYEHAELALVPDLDPGSLAPAQNYVLRPNLRRIAQLRAALLGIGRDLFALTGGLYLRTAESGAELIPVIPPIIEQSHEPDGSTVLLISDGLHRVYSARQAGSTIAAIVVTRLPAEYPYYAYPLRGGWSQVTELAELPTGHQKKDYRQPEHYKALFRDFNAVLPGLQQQRDRTNPAHLTAGF